METSTLTLTKTDTPRIYVACLAAYNNGYLHGAWIDADRDPWAIWADIRDMLAKSPIPDAEEHAIHDYKAFKGVSIAEYAGIDRVAEIAAFIVEHGALGAGCLTTTAMIWRKPARPSLTAIWANMTAWPTICRN